MYICKTQNKHIKIKIMKTFNKKKKEEVLKIALEHQEQDRFIQGDWLKSEKVNELFKGCFFGCMTQTDNNTLSEASKQLQIPLWLVHVSEKIFEGLDSKESLTFPVELLNSIPINNDLDKVWKQWNTIVLTDQLRFVDKDSKQEKAIKEVINLYNTEKITRSAAESARLTAESAWSARSAERPAAKSATRSARSAARSAESAAMSAESAARSAAWSAESAARSAESAARSAARSAAWSVESAEPDYYSFLRDILINILKQH